MMSTPTQLPPAEALPIQSLITPTAGGIASRVLARTPGGNLTLFAFYGGQELSEHTAAMPAILHFIQGEAKLTLGADRVEAKANTWVHMTTGQRHSIQAKTPLAMLLLLLK